MVSILVCLPHEGCMGHHAQSWEMTYPAHHKKYPELRLDNDLIGHEDAHAVYLRIGFILRGETTTDDLICEAHLTGKSY